LNDTGQKDQVIEQLIQWAERQPLVRAMVLTSSRALPGAPMDVQTVVNEVRRGNLETLLKALL